MASGDGYRAFANLRPIVEALGPSEFGRICQILLAFAFLEAGYQVPIMQLSGRPDIVARKKNRGYSLEAKAQLDANVHFKDEDITGVTGTGFAPLLAVLTYPSPDTHWIFADALKLRPGVYNKLSLQRYSLGSLENEVGSLFPGVTDRWQTTAMAGSGILVERFNDVRDRPRH